MKRLSLLLLCTILISSALPEEIFLKSYNPLFFHHDTNYITSASVQPLNDTLSNATEIHCSHPLSIAVPAHTSRYYYFQTESLKGSPSVKPEIQIYGDTDSCSIQLYSNTGINLPISLQKSSYKINCILPEKVFSQERCFLSFSNTSTKTKQFEFILSTKTPSADFLPKTIPIPKSRIKPTKPSTPRKKVRKRNLHKKPSTTRKITSKKSTSIPKSLLKTHFYRMPINSEFSLSDITEGHLSSFTLKNLSPSVISVTGNTVSSKHTGIAIIRMVSGNHITSCTIKVYQKGI